MLTWIKGCCLRAASPIQFLWTLAQQPAHGPGKHYHQSGCRRLQVASSLPVLDIRTTGVIEPSGMPNLLPPEAHRGTPYLPVLDLRTTGVPRALWRGSTNLPWDWTSSVPTDWTIGDAPLAILQSRKEIQYLEAESWTPHLKHFYC